jgi:DNA-binding transcriptional MerR regulator
MKNVTVRTSDAAALVGATHRQLAYWRRRGFVAPRRHTAGGHAIYDEADLRRLRLLKILTTGKRALTVWHASKLLDRIHVEVERMIESARAESAADVLMALHTDRS